MTTQQQPEQPTTEQHPYDLALRVGKIEGLLEAVIEEQRTHRAETNDRFAETNARIDAVNARFDSLDRKFTTLISGGFVTILAAIITVGILF